MPAGGGEGAAGATDAPYILGMREGAGIGGLAAELPPLMFGAGDGGRFAWNTTRREASALPYFGQAGSGVTLHEHTGAWNALAYGR